MEQLKGNRVIYLENSHIKNNHLVFEFSNNLEVRKFMLL